MLTALTAWAAGAATAAAVGLFALSSIDFGLTNRQASHPLGELSVPAETATEDSLDAPPSVTPSGPAESPHPTPTVSHRPEGVERTITSAGGTVVARCTAEGAYLVSWSPAQGFHSDNVHRGPGSYASVQFEGQAGEYKTTVTCVNGVPQGKIYADH